MAKMRVHELAKELNIKSQDVIDTLNGTQFAVKNVQNGLEDEAQQIVRKKYAKTEVKKDAPKKEEPKKDEAKAADRPKKKASITAVFNAQYSKQGRKTNGGNGSGNNGNNSSQRRNGNGRRDNQSSRPEQHSIIKPRPVGERAMRPISERTADPYADMKAANSRPARQADADRRSDRRQDNGEKINNRNTDRNADRSRNTDRNSDRRTNNRDNNNRDNSRDNNRDNNRGFRNDSRRPAEGGRSFDRNNDRSRSNDRNNDRTGGRGDDRNRFRKETVAVAAPDDVRGKESRDRGNDRKNKHNHNQSQKQDKLGKKQENYINLEKHGGKKKAQQPKAQPKEDENEIKTISLPEKITIRDLADRMKVQPSAIVKKLFMKGEMVTVNSEVDFAAAEEIALEFNFICEEEEKVDVIAELLKEDEEDESKMVPRPPVVCVMGHVDHGKTSLLDAIRQTRVTDREAGGITQHIGASVVSINDQNITFLDTPGHEAFTAMRMRGANSTDIAILVVAADDGVMPQTVEAINHAKAAGVEIIVAVNKIDKPSANIDKVKQELSEYELIPEDWGGSTIFCPVSAHTKEGIDNLLEMILLTAEVLELKANPDRNARGLVIEAQLDKGRGAVATVLVQKGTLHVGDPIACGSSYGKVRAMIDDKGRRVKEAKPSTPVEILGLNSVPSAGETFVACDSEKEAKAFSDTYISEEKNKLIEDTKAKMSLDDLFSQIQSGNMKELDIIVKADVQGSVEAVKQSLVKLSNEEVVVKVIHGGVGAINESDVILASASNAIIIGFNVRPDPVAKTTADREGVDIRLYKVIYNAIEDVSAAMKGMLDPVFEEKVIGHAEIRQIFKASGVGNIAGSYVLDGFMERGCRVRISREGEQIFEGDLASLKRFKDDVKEVKTGYECGLVFDGFNDIQELDIVEAYKMVEVPR